MIPAQGLTLGRCLIRYAIELNTRRLANTETEQLSFLTMTAHVADLIVLEYQRHSGAIIVGIDGPDCSGKSTLCRALVTELKEKFRVVPIHLDDYLNAPAHRDQRGKFSVDGFLNDYFDSESLIQSALEPFLFSSQSEHAFAEIMIVEGLFLFRRELVDYFNLRVRLEIDDDLLLRRALARDVGQIGSESWVRHHYLDQCIPAQSRYRETTPLPELVHLVVNVLSEDNYELRR